jgi:hypothetical protein
MLIQIRNAMAEYSNLLQGIIEEDEVLLATKIMRLDEDSAKGIEGCRNKNDLCLLN